MEEESAGAGSLDEIVEPTLDLEIELSKSGSGGVSVSEPEQLEVGDSTEASAEATCAFGQVRRLCPS